MKLKRMVDLFLCLFLIPVITIPCILIAILIKLSSKGTILHWSKRIGKNNEIFFMPKFRSMKMESPQVATHLFDESHLYITGIGRFLRKFSLDEFPQIWCILKGEMSFVGPRPALFNQDDLIKMRTEMGIDEMVPGITGWAQINGRDNISIERKVQFDHDYLVKRSLFLDFKIIFYTLILVIKAKNICH